MSSENKPVEPLGPHAIETDIDDDDPLDPLHDIDPHPSVSPATPAESFFLTPQLRTNRVSAYAIATQLRSSSSRGTLTVATEDFQSAFAEEGEMMRSMNRETDATIDLTDSLFGKDILVLSRSVIPEDEDTFQETMSTTSNATASTEGVNMVQVVYTKAKCIWSWGKGLPLVGSLEGITEAVASKVVSIAGASLSDIDSVVTGVASGLDSSYFNPAISAVVDAIMKGVSKADSTFRPMIEAVVPRVLSPLGIKASESKGEGSTAPEVTTTPVVAIN